MAKIQIPAFAAILAFCLGITLANCAEDPSNEPDNSSDGGTGECIPGETGNKLEALSSKINFLSGKAELTEESKESLDEIAEILINQLSESKVAIGGHTDNVGKPESNQKFSEERSQAVKQYLVEKGIATNRLQAIGYGDTKPIADNKTADGRAKNRRIEFVISC
ncbi:MAG: OmpA family protein [Fibromonadaceae bacterium]|jgi:outer membrane protein OmpA-like peptidoglycan-associated protein|nr:OmpA family protein [Fibromonadaceae bacterium]